MKALLRLFLRFLKALGFMFCVTVSLMLTLTSLIATAYSWYYSESFYQMLIDTSMYSFGVIFWGFIFYKMIDLYAKSIAKCNINGLNKKIRETKN